MPNTARKFNEEEIRELERERAIKLRMQRDRDVMEFNKGLDKAAEEATEAFSKATEKSIEDTEFDVEGSFSEADNVIPFPSKRRPNAPRKKSGKAGPKSKESGKEDNVIPFPLNQQANAPGKPTADLKPEQTEAREEPKEPEEPGEPPLEPQEEEVLPEQSDEAGAPEEQTADQREPEQYPTGRAPDHHPPDAAPGEEPSKETAPEKSDSAVKPETPERTKKEPTPLPQTESAPEPGGWAKDKDKSPEDEGSQKSEEENPEAPQQENSEQPDNQKEGAPGEEKPGSTEGQAEEPKGDQPGSAEATQGRQGEDKKPHQQFDAPEGLGHQGDDEEGKDKKKSDGGGQDKEPSAKENDQERQKGFAGQLGASRNQARNQKQKEDKEKGTEKEEAKKKGKGFVDLYGILIWAGARDMVYLIIGWLDFFLGGLIAASLGTIILLPALSFIRKQTRTKKDKMRLATFFQQKISPGGYYWAKVFLVSHTATLIVVNEMYKRHKGGPIPGVKTPGKGKLPATGK